MTGHRSPVAKRIRAIADKSQSSDSLTLDQARKSKKLRKLFANVRHNLHQQLRVESARLQPTDYVVLLTIDMDLDAIQKLLDPSAKKTPRRTLKVQLTRPPKVMPASRARRIRK